MRGLFSGNGFALRVGSFQLQIVLSPKIFLIAAAIISALALTPNFKATGPRAVAPSPEPPVVLPAPAPYMPPSPISVRNPDGRPGINDLLYLEDFGSNLYTVDSVTGNARLAVPAFTFQPSDRSVRTAEDTGLVASGNTWSPAIPDFWPAGSSVAPRTNSRSRSASSHGTAGNGDFAGASGSSGGASAGGASPESGTTEEADGDKDDAPVQGGLSPPFLPNPLPAFGTGLYYASVGMSNSDADPALRYGSASSGAVPGDTGVLYGSPNLTISRRESRTQAALLPIQTTALTSSAAQSAPPSPDTVAAALTQALQTGISVEATTPTPEPHTPFFLVTALLALRKARRRLT